MRLRRKIRRSTRQYVVVLLICIVVIGITAIFATFVYSNRVKHRYESLLEDYSKEIKENQHTILIATSDIPAGTLITKDNSDTRVEYSSQPGELFITTQDIGKKVLVDIPKGTQILANMIAKSSISTGLRELEYNAIYLGTHVTHEDTVDVRVNFPNGEDYIVISKKVLEGLSHEESSCLMWLEEEEILRMSAAIVDAYKHSGAKIYLTKYIDPQIQEASIVTYIPSSPVLKLIEENPNIVRQCSQELNKNLREELEKRLDSSLIEDGNEVDWELPDKKEEVDISE